MTSSFAPYTSVMETQQITIKSCHIMTKPHHILTKPHHIMARAHLIIKPHHVIILSQYTMTKLQNIKTILQDQRNKDYVRKLWLSIEFARFHISEFVLVSRTLL